MLRTCTRSLSRKELSLIRTRSAFLVFQGRFRMEFRDHSVSFEDSEFLIVPRGVMHRPVANEEVWVLLFEPATTLNTGNTAGELTQASLNRL